ncbi:malonyl-[acyl-carrier protein] O-methyltransferase BioC [Candidatus Williamhamiltonella defendens]|uniref:Malonyl-[acyl-carrier protein] O-methyltransferase n=1 Tax=Candidatus Williamhamiltonella defendens TaxID=138072 RepID=A0A2D3T735_9ENTR|nr:malonyl-ACP O-methyltransferase BioC [Candidatus Hamiltonella defensa]ATW29620.1 malonyl-[acyl-carrier protein] O-methyltransferase BioC [Candidatus Hamiltonella defensa]ATW31597.1 malonyl-[acyl-carrier protein] O-methyltransferase BioC [Candidatus Hamiltonella defensa]
MISKNFFIESVNKTAIASAFSRAAHSYEQAASLQKEVGFRLLQMTGDIKKSWVLDAGCGTGYFSQFWRQKGNRVLSLDLSLEMLKKAKKKSAAQAYLLADIEHLPILDQKIDLCFSNMAIQWCDDLKVVLAEFHRVTRSGGVILFSTLAMGSLKELAQAWQKVDEEPHINRFLSFEEIQQICTPYHSELKMCLSKVCFPDLRSLIQSLRGVGATHLHRGRKVGLSSRARIQKLENAYPVKFGEYPLSYQLVYGIIYRD